MPAGRPSSYTKKLGDLICQRMEAGETLRQICRDEGMPDRHTIFRWCEANEEFRTQYAQAREGLQDFWADEIVEISDDGTNDYMAVKRGDDEVEVVNHEHISRSKLRTDTRKWLMSKLAPKKYGDKLEHSGQVSFVPALQLVDKKKAD